jgi:hypothetical protein
MQRHNSILFSSVILAGTWLSTSGQAQAQFTGSQSRSIAAATRNYLYNRPTVSPYLNLTTQDAQGGAVPNYFTMVRPQIEMREEQVRQQRQSAQMQTQLDHVQTQVRESQQQAAGMMLTGRIGWSSRGYPRFGSHLNFYPGFPRTR